MDSSLNPFHFKSFPVQAVFNRILRRLNKNVVVKLGKVKNSKKATKIRRNTPIFVAAPEYLNFKGIFFTYLRLQWQLNFFPLRYNGHNFKMKVSSALYSTAYNYFVIS